MLVFWLALILNSPVRINFYKTHLIGKNKSNKVDTAHGYDTTIVGKVYRV